MVATRIPLWILILSGLICLSGLFVGGSLYLTPGTFIPGVDFSQSGTRYVANMWAARQVTLACILGFSALRRSVPMLQLALGAYAVMNVQDAAIGAFRADWGLLAGAAIFTLLPGFMVWRLARTGR